jgi:hypothetical protein
MYGLDIQKLLAKAKIAKNHEDKIELLKQAVSIADSKNDVEWGVDLRKTIMEYEYYTPHFHETYSIINWLIGMQEQEPDLISDDDFLWNYKHSISELLYNPTIPKEIQLAIEQDYIRRVEKSGYSKRAFYDIYYRHYTMLQHHEKASHFLALRNAETHDDMSNCEACEIDADVDFALLSDNIEQAKDLAIPLLSNKKSCARVPLITHVNLTNYYTQKGDFNNAEHHCSQALSTLEEKNDLLANLKYGLLLLNYLVQSNQVQKAITIIESIFPSLKNASSDLHFLTYQNMTLSLAQIQQEEISIHFPAWFERYQATNSYKTKDLHKHFDEKRKVFIDQIDQRNQNKDFSNRFLTDERR